MKETRDRAALRVPGEQEVLSYWFPPSIHHADAETYQEQWLRWFAGGLLERARRGELDSWANTPRGRLALIIVPDQFSRGVYKGTPPTCGSPGRASKPGWAAAWKSPNACSS